MAQDVENAVYSALRRHALTPNRAESLPAPVQGWNTRDPVARMEPEFAVVMDNWFPDLGAVRTRRGFRLHANCDTSNRIETLVSHYDGDIAKTFAVADGGIFDVTGYDIDADPAPPPAAAMALPPTIPAVADPESTMDMPLPPLTPEINYTPTTGRWRWVNANGYTVMVNGVDEPLTYGAVNEGTPTEPVIKQKWQPGQWTGPEDTKKLTQVAAHQNRLWFVEAGSSNLWYGGLNFIRGPLSRYPVGLLAENAGDVKAVGSISMDTGSGMDDMLVVLMERGQCIVFAGTDPDRAVSWKLQGVYELPPAVGENPLVKLGGDLVAITEDGFIPILQFVRGGKERTDLALSDPISPTVSDAVRNGRLADGSPLPGWQAVLHTRSRWLLFNVPQSEERFHQYVMNIQTKAWARFTGMNAHCWLVDADGIFYGADGGRIYEADVGGREGRIAGEDQPIVAEARSAYSYCNTVAEKIFQYIRPHFTAQDGKTALDVGAVSDFGRISPYFRQTAPIQSRGSKWNASKWGTFKWTSGPQRVKSWHDIGLQGTAIAVHVRSRSTGEQVTWESVDLRFGIFRGRGGP